MIWERKRERGGEGSLLVPRPSSSRITRLRDVADFRMADVSESSTMNVDYGGVN